MNDRPHILIIDDDGDFQVAVRLVLRDLYEVKTAASPEEGLIMLHRGSTDTVLLDLDFGPVIGRTAGLDALQTIHTRFPELPVIMITNTDRSEPAVKAVRSGAFDYLPKTIDRERLLTVLRNAVDLATARRDRDDMLEDLIGRYALIGPSPALKRIRRQIREYAPSDFPVFITGERGVGKDLVARLLHEHSRRKNKKYHAINMASFPDDLFESEMFGHEKDAFTGANTRRIGIFESVSGGTLFLDEIALATKRAQAKLLRAIQDKAITRVGGTDTIPIDVRIVAATNADLTSDDDAFRSDLLDRLDYFPIYIPPLREHPEDILPIADWFLSRPSSEERSFPPELTAGARAELTRHDWPDNVRGLLKVLIRGQQLLKSGVWTEGDVRRMIDLGKPDGGDRLHGERRGESTLSDTRREAEREKIRATLTTHNGNITHAAAALGISRMSLYRKITTLGLDEALSGRGPKLT